MAGYKETPRQKMIAMLYLVLTALLALNVSKEILDAFLVVNDSMVSTNENIANKIGATYNKFGNQYTLNPDKVEPFWNTAQEVKKESEDLVKYIEDLKFHLIMSSENKDSLAILEEFYKDTVTIDPYTGDKAQTYLLDLQSVPTKDKYDESTRIMINRKGADRLKERIDNYRSFMISKMGPDFETKIGLRTDGDYVNADGEPLNWQYYNFYHTILAADITILNKFISEVQSAYFDALNVLYGNISEEDFKFTDVEAKVIPKSTYVFQNDSYKAEVLIAAVDATSKPVARVLMGADTITSENIGRTTEITGDNGKVQLSFPANQSGLQKYAGIIELYDPKSQSMRQYPFKNEYFVAPPSLTVAPLKMNVFYIGVKNPVSISAPGVPTSALQPTITQGATLYADPSSNDYIVEVNRGVKNATISATAKIRGETVSLGSQEFRVKIVPSPVAKVAGISSGKIDKNTLLAAGAVIPIMEDFDFDLNFVVTSYTFATLVNGDWIPKNVKGNLFTEEVLSTIRNGKRQQKFFFENIQAKGPDGSTRSLNVINIELN